MDLNNMHALKINSFCSGTVLELIDNAVSNGEGIDLVENLCEVDVFIGKYEAEAFEIPNIPLQGTEALIIKIGESLIDGGYASPAEVYDNRSVLDFIGGSKGYKKAYDVISDLKDHEFNMLICWMNLCSQLRFCGLEDLTIGIELKEGNWKKSPYLNMKVGQIAESYYMSHKYENSRMVDIDITVVPSYYWIQLIKKDKAQYNHILKKKV